MSKDKEIISDIIERRIILALQKRSDTVSYTEGKLIYKITEVSNKY